MTPATKLRELFASRALPKYMSRLKLPESEGLAVWQRKNMSTFERAVAGWWFEEAEEAVSGAPVAAEGLGGSLELDKALLANFADQRWVAHIHPDLKNAVDLLVEQFRHSQWAPKQLRKGTYAAAFGMLVANFKQAYEQDRALILPRGNTSKRDDPNNPAGIAPQTLAKVLDFLHEAGHIELHKMPRGKLSREARRASWCRCREALYTLIQREHIVYHEATPVLTLRGADKQDRRLSSRQERIAKSLRKPATVMNETYAKHSLTLHGQAHYPFLYRVFNKDLTKGGRFYSTYQTLPKAERQAFHIDGEAVTEVDFKALHVYLLYWEAGIQLPVGFDYEVPGLERSTAKAITLRALNVEDLVGLERCITKSGNPEVKEVDAAYRERRCRYENAWWKGGVLLPEPEKPKQLKGFIENIPDGAQGKHLLSLFKAAHEPVRAWLGMEDIGIRLQNHDSQIMGRVLTALACRDIPALPVHDSLIVPVSQQSLALAEMTEAYRAHTGGFECPVEVKY